MFFFAYLNSFIGLNLIDIRRWNVCLPFGDCFLDELVIQYQYCEELVLYFWLHRVVVELDEH